MRVLFVLLFLAMFALPTAPADAAEPTEKLYQERCAKCHGKSGKGDGEGLKKLEADVEPIDWTNKAAMSKLSDADLSKIIELGGKGVGKSKLMPAYKGKVSGAEITKLVGYIRSLAK